MLRRVIDVVFIVRIKLTLKLKVPLSSKRRNYLSVGTG
jgi:hypothetical protein